MGCFKFKRALFGLVTVCAAASLFAEDAKLDDNEDGTNENEFEYYWYYYDDNTGCGKDDRSVRAPSTASTDASTIQCKTVKDVERHFEGNAADKYMIKQYTFECGQDEVTKNRFATMPFKLGKGWKVEYPTYSYTAAPYVGLGTMLCGDGKKLDLSKATGFKFDIRSRVTTDLVVKFKVQQLDIEKDSTFGYYEYTIPDVGPEWKTKTVLFTDLAQPDWATDEREREWTPDALTKLGWHIELADGALVDTLDVDNVYVLNYTFVSPKMWTKTTNMGNIYKDMLLGDFEKASNRAFCALTKQYWYAYNDSEIKGTSSVAEASATLDDSTKRLTLKFADASGANGSGYGPSLRYTLGPAVMQHDTVKVKGFVGIGVNLYDSAKAEYFDAKAKNITAVYFNYMTDGDLAYATMEVSDVNDVPDKDNPTRKDSRGSGIVHFRNIPNTKGEWKAVEIPLDSLVEMTDWQGYKEIPLDLSKLAKLQFKVQGAENASGIIAIDNIYFSDGTPDSTGVRGINSRSVVSPFSASYRNGKISINWTGKTAIAEGKISLIDAKGCVVQSSSIAKSSKVSDRISVSNLASGVYMVKLSAVDTNGKAVTMQSSVNIIK